MASDGGSRGIRARLRTELTREIKEAARRQLAADGAAALSLRAIARDLGMVSSALYRYFPSRDDLLTALIVDAYNAIGEAAERADGARPRDDIPGRWIAATRAIRRWAIANPNEYALVYGSPIPGYHAPASVTEPPATRVTAVLAAILRDAVATGTAGPVNPPPLPPSLRANFDRLRAALMPGVSDEAIFRGLNAWTALFGIVSFELFGHLDGVVEDTEAFFDASAIDLGRSVGLKIQSDLADDTVE